MFDICLFDLDETLIRTDDISEIREAGKNISTDAYRAKVIDSLRKRADRNIFSMQLLRDIRAKFPGMKMGIFTRSPRSYALTALDWAYPGFKWDIVVAYEDVARRKPFGDGIAHARKVFGKLDDASLPSTVLVGDSDVDVRAAYNCGCWTILSKKNWPAKLNNFAHRGALELVPDAIIETPEQLITVLSKPLDYLPELERLLLPHVRGPAAARFDELLHYLPWVEGEKNFPYKIFVAGRSFSNYESVQYRRKWHQLSASIEHNKDVEVFPAEWITTVRKFLQDNFSPWLRRDIVVATVPHRPTRTARLESFLNQLAASIKENPIPNLTIRFETNLLEYKDGVKSQHGDFLSREERFINVRDHLQVKNPGTVGERTAYLIIDDVVTTGASLMYSRKYLIEAKAMDVKLLAMAKNVSDVTKLAK